MPDALEKVYDNRDDGSIPLNLAGRPVGSRPVCGEEYASQAGPDIIYHERYYGAAGPIRPSWRSNPGYINSAHRDVFERTKDIPGWQLEGDSYKLFEMGYFAGEDILEIGTFGGRASVILLEGALDNNKRRSGPRYFGIDVDKDAIWRTHKTLAGHRNLLDYALLFHGDLQSFFKELPIRPTMVFLDGDHRYDGVKQDLKELGNMLNPGTPVLMHDFLNPENDTGEYGVRRAAIEWEEAGFAQFYGSFGCSGLYVATEKCQGMGKAVLGWQELVEKKEALLEAYRQTGPPPGPFWGRCVQYLRRRLGG